MHPRTKSSVCKFFHMHPGAKSSVCEFFRMHPGAKSSVCDFFRMHPGAKSSVCDFFRMHPGAKSSVCEFFRMHPRAKSSVCEFFLMHPGAKSSVCEFFRMHPGAKSSVCEFFRMHPGAKSSVCEFFCMHPGAKSSVCEFFRMHPGAKSSVCEFFRPSPPCVNSSICTPEPSPPCVNSSVCTPEPSPPCMNSTECNSKAHFQNVNSSACIPSQNPQCEHSNRNNLGPLQGMHSGTTFPAPQMMCVNSVWCSVQTHLQNVNSSACTRRQESQSANSMGYNPGPHLEAPKLQGMKFPELNPGTRIQREMPITVNPGQHLQDLRLELTPGSNIAGIAPAEYNPGPQEQCMNFSELNPGLELQRINLAKLGSGPQLQNIKSFTWTPGSESQYTRPVLLSPGPPFQGVKPSNLSVGAKFQEIPFLKKQFGSRQQTAQPMLTPKPQSTGVDSVEVLPTPLPEDKMFPEMSKQPLLFLPRSGNSVGLSPSPFLQNVTFGNQIPQTNDQITEPSKVTGRPAHHLVDYAEMNTKIRYQAPKLVNYIPLPVYQEDAGSSEMMKGLGHKSTETTEKSMRLTSKPTDTVTESLGMPQQPELQVPGLTPTLCDQKGSRASELTPPIPFISSSVKTSKLGPLQGSGMPEVSRARTMKNFNVGILQSPESYTDTIRIRSPALPLVLPFDKTGNSVGSLYPEIWDMDVITKESTEKKQMEEFGNSLQSYFPYPLRLLPSEFQAGLGARRNSIRSFLGRQLNIWESHVCRQRLPRKYLSNMLMLGNVLGTTMERKLCSQPFLTEGATMGICQSIQNLFGVPAELMEFSQSLLERGPRTISQTSVVKNYIQRRILGHGHEKRIPLKMWTRGSTSSIIQQYSGTRLGLKKTNSKLSDVFQEVTQHVPVSCTGAQFPALGKPESPLGILYSREDPVSREPSNISQSDSQTRTSESHHSFEASYFSQTNTELSEELKDLKLKIAAKLLRSQIPHNVPPPPETGLVHKYPICLQCGLLSEFGCGHKFQSAYLLVYPQIRLIKTPEGRGEIQTHLGFRLHIRKRPQVSKDCGRNRADTSKNPSSSSHRKAKIYTPASKSPTSTRDFQSRSSQSPASVPVHRRQKQWGSHGVAGKTEAKDSGHYEFCEVLSASESDCESNQHEKWAKSRLSKTSDLKYPMKKITKELKKQKLYKTSRPTEECPSGTLTDPSTQTSTVSSKRQPKKSSQPRFIQLLFQGLKQAFQRAHRAMAITRQKPEDRASPDNLWSSKNLYPEEKDEDDGVTDGRGASTPLIKQKFMGSTHVETCDQDHQSKQVSSLQPRPLELAKNIVSMMNYEFFSPESKNCSKVGAKFQVQETLVPDSLLKRTMQSHFKHEQEQHRAYHSLSERSHRRRHSPQRKPRSPSDRTLRSLSERRCRSPSQRKDGSPSRRTPQSISDRSPPRLSKGRGRSPSGRSQPSPSGRRPRSSSGRSPRSSTPSSPRERRGRNPSPKGSPPYQRCRSPSKRSHLSPIRRTWDSPSERSHGTLSERPPSRLSGRTSQSSSGRGYHSPSRSRLHKPSSGLHRSHSRATAPLTADAVILRGANT
ncbi:uncharacterized protein LOC142839266 [Microtus pennsylvanicus]|uniref:uncharacterized protein LOC142839266 n=1 Tax=Microtus pennsylvanicus TaxID=10058 RepID=UPI003F6AC2FD